MLVGKSLNAATSTGPGATIWTDVPKTNVSCQITYTGSPDEAEISFETTLDRVNWKSVPIFAASADASGKLVGQNNLFPFIGARVNLTSLIGGTSPTVSAVVGVA